MLRIQSNITPIVYRGNVVSAQDSRHSDTVGYTQFSTASSDAITNTRKGLIRVNKIVPLDKTSEAAVFFGVDSRQSVDTQLMNQLALTLLKTNKENIINLPNTSIYSIMEGQKSKKLEKSINKFMEAGVGRWTLHGDKGESHTIGLVKHKDNIYVLDSLNSYYQDLSLPHEAIGRLFGGNVVFSTKPQQKNDEYACNNWTHANIDAVLAAAREDRLTPDNLDDILPNDINKVLEEQKAFVEKNYTQDTLIKLYRKNKSNF